MGFLDDTTLARFWSKVKIQGNGCWHLNAFEWEGGYPCFWCDGKNMRASRFSLIAFYGWPADNTKSFACHTCNNAECVNPDHLYWGSAKDNHEDFIQTEKGMGHIARTGFQKGHAYFGYKMKASEVGYIKLLQEGGFTDKYIGKCYGVPSSTVRSIRAGKTYSDIPPSSFSKVKLMERDKVYPNSKRTKLRIQDVLEILNSTESSKVLSERFGVRDNAIQRIRNGERWGDIRAKWLQEKITLAGGVDCSRKTAR